MSNDRIVQSVHQRLLNVRDRTGESFDRLLMRYGLERLLYRIYVTGHADTFVLKGAMLFALWHGVPGRSTRDLDLLGIAGLSHDRLRTIFTDACEANVEEDGLYFDPDSIQTKDIRDDQEYHGVRVRLRGYLGSAKLAIQVDVGFGDVVTPSPITIDYPSILGFPQAHLRAYHPATVVAEKLNAMVVLGMFNSRMKDFYDMHIVLSHMRIPDALLGEAILATFARRRIRIPHEMPVAFTPDFSEDNVKETQWQAFLRRSALESFHLSLRDVMRDLRDRLWPILDGCREKP